MAKPTGWNRFFAKVQGEVPAAELDAFRRASAPVFELLEQVERRRLECSIDGLDPWTIPPATRAAFLCAWNAFVLQTLGDEFLDADYRAEPRTPHFVPPVTAEQVLRFYEQVEGWVNRAWQAQANPDFRLDVPVPAPLPAWGEGEPFPSAHLPPRTWMGCCTPCGAFAITRTRRWPLSPPRRRPTGSSRRR